MNNIFAKALNTTFNNETSITENGAVGFKTTSSKLLDIHFAASSLRKKSEAEIRKMFSEAYQENPLLAVKWLFMLRDCRGGMGERRSFRICLKWLANYHPDIVKRLIPLCAEYGRFDDLFCLISMAEGDAVEDAVLGVIDEQWANDVLNMSAKKPISLLAKWMPSISTSSKKTVALARFFCKELALSEKQYRKTLSAMRKYLDVVEVKESAKKWSEIDYEKVPSLANCKYKNAFMRNDKARRTEFLNKLTAGEAKINSAVCFPSDIVHSYSKGAGYFGSRSTFEKDATLEAMWKSLPDMCIGGNIICVVDGSGSMTTTVGSGSLTALEVANALGIYCSEHLTGPFKDKFITFSVRPQYVDLGNADSLAEKLEIAYSHDECANTNIEATFDLLLQTAVDNNLKQEDIPTVVILSDMEMDDGTNFGGAHNYHNYYLTASNNFNSNKVALMQKISKRWKSVGFALPRLIWWNIASRTGTVPMQQNELGVIMCSGYSQSQFKMIASNKTDSYEVLVESLNDKRYQPVEDAVKDVI